VKLKWLEIERFRNVRPGTRLDFDDGFNVVLGRNGTGKTTLLRLLQAVVSGSYAEFEGEPIKIRGELMGGEGSVYVSFDSTPETRKSAPSVGESPASMQRLETAHWSYETQFVSQSGTLTARSTPEGLVIRVADKVVERTAVSPFSVAPYRSILFEILESGTGAVVAGSLDALGEWEGHLNCRFDESTALFRRITSHEHSFGPGLQLHYIEQLQASGGGGGFRDGFMSMGFFEAHSHPLSDFEEPVIAFTSETGQPLRSIADSLGARRVAMCFNRSSLTGSIGKRVAIFARPELHVTFPSGLTLQHDSLSYGQKRLLAFVYYLETIPGPVIADELVNGFHHTWVENCLDLIRNKGMQAFLTSQNPLLIDYLEFDSAEAAQRAFTLCELEGDDVVWRQMTDDEAQSFYAAYETGVQHVGDILRTKGLW
jgi:energy-coupling factor transporter ATP-binding protein EcfA2